MHYDQNLQPYCLPENPISLMKCIMIPSAQVSPSQNSFVLVPTVVVVAFSTGSVAALVWVVILFFLSCILSEDFSPPPETL